MARFLVTSAMAHCVFDTLSKMYYLKVINYTNFTSKMCGVHNQHLFLDLELFRSNEGPLSWIELEASLRGTRDKGMASRH